MDHGQVFSTSYLTNIEYHIISYSQKLLILTTGISGQVCVLIFISSKQSKFVGYIYIEFFINIL